MAVGDYSLGQAGKNSPGHLAFAANQTPTCLSAVLFTIDSLPVTGLLAERGEAPVLGVRSMKLYVGNLSYSTTQESLENTFKSYGQVDEVAIITDRETGRPRGFAFVSMGSDDEARSAIEGVNGMEIDGRTVTVNEARPKANRASRGASRRW